MLCEPRMAHISGPAINRYVDILMDKWFKKIFDAEGNKDALLELLRELIPERKIVDIRYDRKKKRKKSPFVDGHDAIFDVECIDERGARFVVEMQVEEQLHFHERALFYATFPIQEQVQAQQKQMDPRTHDEQFDFPPVYVISFLNFTLHKWDDRILYRYNLREVESDEPMTDRLNFIFLEMANYQKPKPSSEDSFVEKLSYAFTHMRWLSERPAELSERVFGLIFAACEVARLEEQEIQEYNDDVMTTELDRRNILYTREIRGYERGREEGLERGRKEGREEGREEGSSNRALEIARRMLERNLPLDSIVECTGLTEKQVREL